VFVLNLYDHCIIGHLDKAAVSEAFERMSAASTTDFDLDDDPSQGAEDDAKAAIYAFRDQASAIPELKAGAISPDPLEFCYLSRAYKLEVYEQHISAAIAAARTPSPTPNPLTAGDVWPNWFTQDHDLVMRSGTRELPGPVSSDFMVSRLGLIHFWDRSTTLCVVHLHSTNLASEARRPTSIDGEANPAYLAVSKGERFSRSLAELTGSPGGSFAEHGRALELSDVEDSDRLVDGGVEVIIPLTNEQIAENIVGGLQVVGPVPEAHARQAAITEVIDRLRCTTEVMEKVYEYFDGST
jgi:hypothetical protein